MCRTRFSHRSKGHLCLERLLLYFLRGSVKYPTPNAIANPGAEVNLRQVRVPPPQPSSPRPLQWRIRRPCPHSSRRTSAYRRFRWTRPRSRPRRRAAVVAVFSQRSDFGVPFAHVDAARSLRSRVKTIVSIGIEIFPFENSHVAFPSGCKRREF